MTTYTHDSENLDEIFVGRRIIAVDMNVPAPAGAGLYSGTGGGKLTLDNGTVYACGNYGCSGCTSGYYYLTHLAKVDNIITSVKVEVTENGGDKIYRLFVFADNEAINVAQFEGDDGTGYYGTGFELYVLNPNDKN